MAKTLFNTSEKSNFILNLTAEKYSKTASLSLILPFILIICFIDNYNVELNHKNKW